MLLVTASCSSRLLTPPPTYPIGPLRLARYGRILPAGVTTGPNWAMVIRPTPWPVGVGHIKGQHWSKHRRVWSKTNAVYHGGHIHVWRCTVISICLHGGAWIEALVEASSHGFGMYVFPTANLNLLLPRIRCQRCQL